MLAFAVRRLLQSVVVMFFVALVAYSMFAYVGDPVHQMVGIETTMAEREALREKLGLKDPPVVQFARFVAPGARRVLCTATREALATTAFANPDGSLAVVVLNRSDDALSCVLVHDGRQGRIDLPAHAIATCTLPPALPAAA